MRRRVRLQRVPLYNFDAASDDDDDYDGEIYDEDSDTVQMINVS